MMREVDVPDGRPSIAVAVALLTGGDYASQEVGSTMLRSMEVPAWWRLTLHQLARRVSSIKSWVRTARRTAEELRAARHEVSEDSPEGELLAVLEQDALAVLRGLDKSLHLAEGALRNASMGTTAAMALSLPKGCPAWTGPV